MHDQDAREERARQRAARMTIRKTALGAVDPIEPDRLRGELAVSLVWELTLSASTLAGKALPNYRRGDAPCRFVPWSERPRSRFRMIEDLLAALHLQIVTSRRRAVEVGGRRIPTIGLEALTCNKRASGRPQDVVSGSRMSSDSWTAPRPLVDERARSPPFRSP